LGSVVVDMLERVMGYQRPCPSRCAGLSRGADVAPAPVLLIALIAYGGTGEAAVMVERWHGIFLRTQLTVVRCVPGQFDASVDVSNGA
jgi:hypothetical protein